MPDLQRRRGEEEQGRADLGRASRGGAGRGRKFIYAYLDQISIKGDEDNRGRDDGEEELDQGSTHGSPRQPRPKVRCPFPYPLQLERARARREGARRRHE